MNVLTPDAAMGGKMTGPAQAESQLTFRIRRALVLSSTLLSLAFTFVPNSGCSSKVAPSEKSASHRLHLVAVLYGKYLSANGEMPADQKELVNYVDSNQREILQRYGLRSAEDIFIEAAGQPRLVVLYRDQRQRLPTEFVAMEEEKAIGEQLHGQKTDAQDSRSKWVAADMLGIGQEISAAEANRVLADVSAAANKSPEPAREMKSTDEKEKDKKMGQRSPRAVQPRFARQVMRRDKIGVVQI
jgi:hypothetical protein